MYTIKAKYSGEFANMENEQEINSFEYGEYVGNYLNLDALYVDVNSNFPDAQLIVNGKNTEMLVSDINELILLILE